MEGILSVFKLLLETKIRKVLDSAEISGKIKAAVDLMRHISLQNGNKFYSTSFYNKHIDTLELYTL